LTPLPNGWTIPLMKMLILFQTYSDYLTFRDLQDIACSFPVGFHYTLESYTAMSEIRTVYYRKPIMHCCRKSQMKRSTAMYDIKAAAVNGLAPPVNRQAPAVNRLAPAPAFGVRPQPSRGGQSPTQKVHSLYMTDPSSHDEVSQFTVDSIAEPKIFLLSPAPAPALAPALATDSVIRYL
jgi:hypothetical protein